MHYLYFVIVKADSSVNAMKEAEAILLRENFALETRGYFAYAKADWFVIGGRWSGLFTKIKYKKEFELIDALTDEKQKTDLYERLLPEISSKYPLKRTYSVSIGWGTHLFYDDDAEIITNEFLDVLKNMYGDIEVFDSIECSEYLVKDLSGEYNQCYIVIVDYHN